MGKRTKLEKFAENLRLPNVFENLNYAKPALSSGLFEEVDFKNRWAKDCFKNDNRLILELACGRGEYSLGLAALSKEYNIIGVDIKGARIWQGAKYAIERGYNNIAFLRTKIELVDHFFGNEELSEIWITFPDPFLKTRKSNRRLTSKKYLDVYYPLLKTNAMVHLKTDDDTLFNYSMKVVEEHPDFEIQFSSNDIYSISEQKAEWNIETYYERMHKAKGKKIKLMSFMKK